MDITPKPLNIALHLGLYIGILLVMKFLYVDPVLRLLRRRDSLTEGRKKSGEELQSKLLSMKQTIDAQTNTLKAELEGRRQDALRVVHKESEERSAKIKKELEAKLLANSARLQANYGDLRKQLPSLGEDLGREMAEAVMSGRVVKL